MSKPEVETIRSATPVPPAIERRAHERKVGLLPTLAPVDEVPESAARLTLEQALRLSQNSVRDESTDFRDRAEARDPIAVLTVYAINAMVLLFAFPIGMALLVFNILGGENLRTTSHAMALTGLASALPALGYSVPFLS